MDRCLKEKAPDVNQGLLRVGAIRLELMTPAL
jgi:hypothetical protein